MTLFKINYRQTESKALMSPLVVHIVTCFIMKDKNVDIDQINIS